MIRPFAITAALVAFAACKKEEEGVQVNAVGDCLRVEVRPGAIEGDDDSASGDDDSAATSDCDVVSEVDLVPLAGLFDLESVGQAAVTPARAPANTELTVAVELVDTATAQGNPVEAVARATVSVNNGSFDYDVFEMEESPGDERRWFVRIAAGGLPDTTQRCESLCVALWSETND